MSALCLGLVLPLGAQETGRPERPEGAHDRATGAAEGDDRATGAADAAVEKAVRETVAAFKRALRTGDSAAALSLLHPDVQVYEGGHAETREEYRSGHLEADMAFLQAVSSETIRDAVVSGPRMALYLSQYRTTGTFRGRRIDSHGTETMVLVPAADGWRIRHIHWSSR